jgi:hypothetical protein
MVEDCGRRAVLVEQTITNAIVKRANLRNGWLLVYIAVIAFPRGS